MGKKLTLITYFLCVVAVVNAQPIFDSISYANRHSKILAAFNKPNSDYTELTSAEKIEGVSKVWSEAKYGFANFDLVPYLNWDSAYVAFIPKVEATKTIVDYYNVLKQFNQLLRDGHSRIMEPLPVWEKTTFSAPLRVKRIEGRAIVTALMDNMNRSTTMEVGDEIVAIDNVPVQKYIINKIAPFIKFSTPQDSVSRIYSYELLSGAANSKVKLTIKDASGKLRLQIVDRILDLRKSSPISFAWLADSIAYISITTFGNDKIPEQFDSLFSIISSSKGLIIDIRYNRGENSNNGYEILGRLTDTPFATNQSINKKYDPVQRSFGNSSFEIVKNQSRWKPYKNGSYTRKVVVLTSAFTYSAAEDFTAAFTCMKRGLVVGQKAGCSTGNPLSYSLPGGGVGFVCSKRDLMPDGSEFVGKGINPNLEVNETLSEIKHGIDLTLLKAVDFLTK